MYESAWGVFLLGCSRYDMSQPTYTPYLSISDRETHPVKSQG